MNIRLIQPNELNELLALYAHLHRSDDPPEEAMAQAAWQELLANPIQSLFFRPSLVQPKKSVNADIQRRGASPLGRSLRYCPACWQAANLLATGYLKR